MHNIFTQYFPQNYLIKKELRGSVIFTLMCFVFTLIYRPLNTHESIYFGYELTLIIYSVGVFIAMFLTIPLIKKIRYLSNEKKWTLPKELTAILILLFSGGVSTYLVAFIIEEPTAAQRLNIITFLDSLSRFGLIGIIPYMIFSAKNIKELFVKRRDIENSNENIQSCTVHIKSTLKSENLSINPENIIYIMADGNYVDFYILNNQNIDKQTIRNSISNIHKQLSHLPYIIKTHRAYIVNVKMVKSKKGNSSGYKLKIDDSIDNIPVSRNNIKLFDNVSGKYL
ncbi:MAG: LytTR family transcriptional regulator DNA-binding domain-containing protein [Bacteroidales bacterium]|jgi:hypothetical protein|nr:LytTR family transcriptional regulator DNA-binding domain-containing protein [Bacteroidales bacterium]